MNKPCHYTKKQILEKTREVIHFFANKQMKKFASYLDEDFVWIGDYEALYTKGIDAFMETVAFEKEQAVVNMTEEEYVMLAHERQLWVTYGRFTMTGNNEQQEILVTKVHFTFTWIQRGDTLKLILANATHVKSIPSMLTEKEPPKQVTQSKIFEAKLPNEFQINESKKIAFKDIEGAMRYLFPEEIIYIHSRDKLCMIHTGSGVFSSRMTISSIQHDQLLSIHRSYIVNRRYIKMVKRYEATLFDGTILPVGRDKYQSVRELLQS